MAAATLSRAAARAASRSARAAPAPARVRARAPCRRAAARAAADDALAGYEPKGAQYVGMAKELTEEVPAAAELFKKAEEILGYDLLDVCVNGPAEKLNSTAVSQPAIYVSSLAAIEKLRAQEGGQEVIDSCNVAAGLSLGEYTALTFAGALTFEDGLKLVKVRGESMQAAADATPSGMASVIGLDKDKVGELCAAANADVAEGEGVEIANFLCPGNYAVSGGIPGIEAVEAKAKPDFKARMVVRLAVAGAFHTRFMEPAAAQLGEALAATTISEPKIPVVSNVDVVPHSDADTIRAILGKQLTGPVQWEDTLNTLIEKGTESAYEIGPGKVIAGICKRVDKVFAKKVTNIEA